MPELSWKKRLSDRIDLMSKEDPQFAEEYRAATNAHRVPLFQRVFRWLSASIVILPIIMLPAMMIFLSLPGPRMEYVAAITGYLLTILTFLIAGLLQMRAQSLATLFVHLFGPVSEEALARRIWKRVFLGSLIALLYLFAANYVWLTPLDNVALRLVVSLAFAILQWGFALGAGTWLGSSFPEWYHGSFAFLLFFIAIIIGPFLVFANVQIADILSWLGMLLPASWAGVALWRGVLLEDPVWLPAALPALWFCIRLPQFRTSLIERFSIQAYLVQLGVESSGPAVEGVADAEEPPSEVSEDEVRTNWRNGAESGGWTQRGWQERIIARWLKPQERRLVTFLIGDEPKWSYYWNLTFTIQLVFGPFLYWASENTNFFIFALLGIQGLMLLGPMIGPLAGLLYIRTSGASVANFANYPLRTGTISRLIFKLSVFESISLGIFVLPVIVFLGLRRCVGAIAVVAILFTWMMCASLWRVGVLLTGGLFRTNITVLKFWSLVVRIGLLSATFASPVIAVLLLGDRRYLPQLIPSLILCWVSSIAAWWLSKKQVDRGHVDLVRGLDPSFLNSTYQ